MFESRCAGKPGRQIASAVQGAPVSIESDNASRPERDRRRVRAYVVDPLRAFLETEAAGGAILLFAAATALTWANSPWAASYSDLWSGELGLGTYRLSLRDWIGDGLMTVFFFVVGLEIKRELVSGELQEGRKAVLPVIAAIGGMAGPAAIYLSLNAGTPTGRGWGVPVATDIAFAVGVLAILGKRVPDGLKVFLLALAIADDIGGILVIAAFYSDDLSASWLGVAAAAFAFIPLLRRIGVRNPLLYLPLGIVAWAAMFQSGVHPTIAGVALGLLTPARVVNGRSVLEDLQGRLHPLSSYAIVPLFALASAGISLDAQAMRSAVASNVFWGIVAGLFVGKTLGISVATAVAVRLRLGRLPDGVHAVHVIGVAAIAGTGFTVALFMARLAFVEPGALDIAKAGILFGSILSAVVGALVLSRVRSAGTTPARGR